MDALQGLAVRRRLFPAIGDTMSSSDLRSVSHFPIGKLQASLDASGARFWAVTLERVQLTYFEVPPGARFENHQHESEQITMVLEGELIFSADAGEFLVRAGEVIAIPPDVSHAVRTGTAGARAIDAWSPPMERYQQQT